MSDFEMASVAAASIVVVLLAAKLATGRAGRWARIRRLNNRFAGAPLYRLSGIREEQVRRVANPVSDH
ncbi:hypothetical protein JMJ55_29910 [Belnapia sp. T6]|uniref:DUF1127 domain-containing protein n=1 Tax=Belnapia mucosa TaxID=2804532 RepID=A0ABS1VCW0_9PROT|nr:hypothetical protein [Belnapia mucosa]MBL6459527.1 hypothetical protein [Belnapia mucosa]